MEEVKDTSKIHVITENLLEIYEKRAKLIEVRFEASQ